MYDNPVQNTVTNRISHRKESHLDLTQISAIKLQFDPLFTGWFLFFPIEASVLSLSINVFIERLAK